MQIFTWSLRLVVFLVFVCFAAVNSENITLYFFHDSPVEMPLSVCMLAFFGLGVLLTIFTSPRRKVAENK